MGRGANWGETVLGGPPKQLVADSWCKPVTLSIICLFRSKYKSWLHLTCVCFPWLSVYRWVLSCLIAWCLRLVHSKGKIPTKVQLLMPFSPEDSHDLGDWESGYVELYMQFIQLSTRGQNKPCISAIYQRLMLFQCVTPSSARKCSQFRSPLYPITSLYHNQTSNPTDKNLCLYPLQSILLLSLTSAISPSPSLSPLSLLSTVVSGKRSSCRYARSLTQLSVFIK